MMPTRPRRSIRPADFYLAAVVGSMVALIARGHIFSRKVQICKDAAAGILEESERRHTARVVAADVLRSGAMFLALLAPVAVLLVGISTFKKFDGAMALSFVGGIFFLLLSAEMQRLRNWLECRRTRGTLENQGTVRQSDRMAFYSFIDVLIAALGASVIVLVSVAVTR